MLRVHTCSSSLGLGTTKLIDFEGFQSLTPALCFSQHIHPLLEGRSSGGSSHARLSLLPFPSEMDL
jgi:hypothetical protein